MTIPKQTIAKVLLVPLACSVVALWVMSVQSPHQQSVPVAQSNHKTTKELSGGDTHRLPSDAPNNQLASPHTISNSINKRYYLLDTPNDPYYNSAWHLSAVQAPAAWALSNDSSSVSVAVIDSGFALNHQDLSSAWKINTGEYGDGKETDGIDNDNNGYTDDYRGWDFVQNDNQPQTGTLNPSGQGTQHGTEVAGLVGAVSNNGLGVASVARNVQILPLQVVDDNGNGFSDDVAQAIIYAIDQGVNVINISLGTSGDDPAVRNVIDYAVEHNVTVVAAAGNCGSGNQSVCSGQSLGYITFPASYNRVISVGATTSTGTRASFSSYGERLDIVAPGSGSIASPSWSSSNQTSLYATSLQGTSFASPIVASAAALIRSARPDSSVDDIRALLMGSSVKLSGMSGTFYTPQFGHGLLNIYQALLIAQELNQTEDNPLVARQTGGHQAEHNYDGSESIGSGCVALENTWCTTWLRNKTTNAERFLPYTKSESGEVGWTFTSGVLYRGTWEVYARQGDNVSSEPYLLLKK